MFQILGGKPGTPFGVGCWGTNTTTGYVAGGLLSRTTLAFADADLLRDAAQTSFGPFPSEFAC